MKSLFLTITLLSAALLSTPLCNAAIESPAATADAADNTIERIEAADTEATTVSGSKIELEKPIKIKSENMPGITIQVLGLLVPFATSIGIVWLVLYYRRERQRDRLRIIEISLTSGRPLPPEFYYTTPRPIRQKLQSGIRWIGGGLAIIMFFAMVEAEMWPIGIFPLFIGIANIAVYIAGSRERQAIATTDKDAQQD